MYKLIQIYINVTLVLPTKILERVMLLKRFVGVFKQCKQSFDSKGLQLSSRNNKSRLKMSWTRFIRKSCSKIYILKKIFLARHARCRACWALLAQLVVEHVEHCSLNSLSSMSSTARSTRCRACRALLV